MNYWIWQIWILKRYCFVIAEYTTEKFRVLLAYQKTDTRRQCDEIFYLIARIKRWWFMKHKNTLTFSKKEEYSSATTSPTSKYHITLFNVAHHLLQSTNPPFSKYHTTLFKVSHHHHQSTTPPSSDLQSTTPPSSKYHTTVFKVPVLMHRWHIRLQQHNVTWQPIPPQSAL